MFLRELAKFLREQMGEDESTLDGTLIVLSPCWTQSCAENNLLITNGASGALYLLASRMKGEANSCCVVDNATYFLAIKKLKEMGYAALGA